MNSLPLHPSIVHLPMALAVLMPIASLVLLVAWWRDWLPRRTWWLAVALQAALVGGAYAAVQTGEADEERVEQVVASEASIEAHEEAAELFLYAGLGALGLFAVAGLIRREPVARGVAAAAVLATLAVGGLGYNVGHAGGELVYLDGAARAYATGGGAPAAVADRHDDDDHDDDDDD